MNEVEKFDPSKLMDGVRDRIKSTFVSLIPDEAWNSMVEKEIYVFTTGTIETKCDTDFSQKDENGNYMRKIYDVRTPYTGKTITDNWGKVVGESISPLQKMIREELQAKFRENIKEYLNGPDYQAVYDQYGAVEVGKAIEDVLIKNTDTIFKNFMASVMQKAFDDMRYRVQSGNY